MKSDLTVWEENKRRIAASGNRSHLRVFKVDAPVTIFVRGTKCKVTVQYHELEQVELHAHLYNAFGLQFVTEQDDAGVYIVAKRRRFLGWISRAEFVLRVPAYANLAFNVTPGTVQLEQVTGVVNISPLTRPIPISLPQ
ncbi:MAG: hypothetical protein K8I82_20605, partial [Anaerolineae bacterium]|nr:hypothetical protein [Anaerolineae bacterium]